MRRRTILLLWTGGTIWLSAFGFFDPSTQAIAGEADKHTTGIVRIRFEAHVREQAALDRLAIGLGHTGVVLNAEIHVRNVLSIPQIDTNTHRVAFPHPNLVRLQDHTRPGRWRQVGG